MAVKGEVLRAAGVLADPREHRRDQRLRIDLKIRYKVIQKKGNEKTAQGFRPDGRGVNISLCGLAISTGTALKKGDYLKLELSLPGRAQPVRALAEVMWTSEETGHHFSGIRFLILLDQADDASIRRFIAEHPDRSGS